MWQLPKEKTQPIYQSIVALVMTHLQEGRLLPGEKLPPERVLAQAFGVNRSTVVHALAELEAMGVVIRKQGSGTTINDGKWGIYTGSTTNWRNYLTQGGFQQKDPALERLTKLAKQADEKTIDAYTGELPLELIPSLTLPSISWRDFLSEEAYEDELGYLPLRELLVKQLNEERGLQVKTDQLLLTSGGQQALFLIIQVLLQTGDAIAIEEPSSFYALSMFQAAGIRLYGVPVDKEGMRVDLLAEKIVRHKIKLVLVNPNGQNPTGTTMSLARRQELISLCQVYQLPIVEDDVFGQLLFSEKKQPVLLKELDPENVIYIGSLSKLLGTTTKIGWVSGPVRVTQKLAAAQGEMDFSLSIFPQVLAANALSHHEFKGELIKLRGKLAERRDALIAEIEQQLGSQVSFVVPEGGYYLWLRFETIELKAREFDWLLEQQLLALPSFFFGVGYRHLRLNFARLTSQASKELVAGLGRLIAEKTPQPLA